jgi:hypothetical protein
LRLFSRPLNNAFKLIKLFNCFVWEIFDCNFELFSHVNEFLSGAIWPQPKTQVSSNNFNTIRPTVFNFETVGNSCDILENALTRYKVLISIQLRRVRNRMTNVPHDNNWRKVPEYLGHLDSLKVDLTDECEKLPYLNMDESCKYQLKICFYYLRF